MKSPSNWINLQDFLGVNEEAGKQMAGQVTGSIGKQAEAATHQLGDAQSAFDARVKNDPNAYDAKEQAVATKAPQAYGGPSDLSGVDSSLASNLKDAAQRVQAVNTQDGQVHELGAAYGGKSSTNAGGGLDAFLLSGAGGGAMADLNTQYGTLDAKYDTANSAARKTASDASVRAGENQKAWASKAAAETAAASEADQAMIDAENRRVDAYARSMDASYDPNKNVHKHNTTWHDTGMGQLVSFLGGLVGQGNTHLEDAQGKYSELVNAREQMRRQLATREHWDPTYRFQGGQKDKRQWWKNGVYQGDDMKIIQGS